MILLDLNWEELEDMCLNCHKCPLSQTRHNVVIGKGSKKADIMFIGEGPGEQEDLQGVPFVGAAGQLLDKMLLAAGLDETDYYITNIVKCRPPYNRDPLEEEQRACINYLRRQFLLVRPKIIVCLGRIAAKAVINSDFKITKDRGIWIERKNTYIIATFHPSAVLRDITKKKPAWEDMKEIRRKLLELRKEQQIEG